MSDKYKVLTGPKYTKVVEAHGRPKYAVHRIRALKSLNGVNAGDLGGWLESEKNLSQIGSCWIADEGVVLADAKVMGDSWVGDNAFVYDKAMVTGKAAVTKGALVYDRALIRDKAWVSDNAEVYGDAKLSENAQVFGKAKVFGTAEVKGTAEAYDNAKICDTAIVGGTAIVCGNAIVDGIANIEVGKVTGHISATIEQTFTKPKKIPEPVISPERLLPSAEESNPWFYTVDQLRLMCKKQHKSTEGKKEDLMLRLFPNKGRTPPWAPRPGMYWNREYHTWIPV